MHQIVASQQKETLVPPFLKADLEYFLGRDVALHGAKGGEDPQWDYLPKPSLKDSAKWVEWRADQIDTPEWWPELSTVFSEQDTKEFAWKI